MSDKEASDVEVEKDEVVKSENGEEEEPKEPEEPRVFLTQE